MSLLGVYSGQFFISVTSVTKLLFLSENLFMKIRNGDITLILTSWPELWRNLNSGPSSEGAQRRWMRNDRHSLALQQVTRSLTTLEPRNPRYEGSGKSKTEPENRLCEPGGREGPSKRGKGTSTQLLRRRWVNIQYALGRKSQRSWCQDFWLRTWRKGEIGCSFRNRNYPIPMLQKIRRNNNKRGIYCPHT